MNYKDFYQKQLEISVASGINQRFHQKVARRWAMLNRIVQVSVAVLAVTALCLVINEGSWPPKSVEVWVASFAALAAIALNVIPLGDWVQEHLELFRRWCDLREEVDCLLIELDDKPPPQKLIDDLKRAAAKVHRVSSAEPGLSWYDERLFQKCEVAEKTSRQNIAKESIPVIVPLPRLAIEGFKGLWRRPKAS